MVQKIFSNKTFAIVFLRITPFTGPVLVSHVPPPPASNI